MPVRFSPRNPVRWRGTTPTASTTRDNSSSPGMGDLRRFEATQPAYVPPAQPYRYWPSFDPMPQAPLWQSNEQRRRSLAPTTPRSSWVDAYRWKPDDPLAPVYGAATDAILGYGSMVGRGAKALANFAGSFPAQAIAAGAKAPVDTRTPAGLFFGSADFARRAAQSYYQNVISAYGPQPNQGGSGYTPWFQYAQQYGPQPQAPAATLPYMSPFDYMARGAEGPPPPPNYAPGPEQPPAYYDWGGSGYTQQAQRRPGMGYYQKPYNRSPNVPDWYGQMISWNISGA